MCPTTSRRPSIRDLRAAAQDPEDYTARSNLMWAATMAENRVIKLNKLTDFQAHMMEHQLGAYTDCNHGAGLAVLHPVYYRKICDKGADAAEQAGVQVERLQLDGMPHGFGAMDGWIPAYDAFLTEIFQNN